MGKSRKSVLRRKKFWLSITFGFLGIIALGSGVLYFVIEPLPDPGVLKVKYPWLTVEENGGVSVVFRNGQPPLWVPLNEMSEMAIQAVRLSEDWGFFGHEGVDFHEIKESFKKNLVEGEYARGASTITQQVARNLFLVKDKTLQRKIREIILAKKMEKILTKNKILEIYLNIVEWGDGVYGIKQASQLYFSKEPWELGAKEGAFLAMLLPSPKRYSESFREGELSPYARKITHSILRKLHRAGYLTEEALNQEERVPLSFEEDRDELAPYFESEAY